MISSMAHLIDADGRRLWAAMNIKIHKNQFISIEFQRFRSSTVGGGRGGGLADAHGRSASVSIRNQ